MKMRFSQKEKFPIHVSGKCLDESWLPPKLTDAWKVFLKVLREFHGESNVKAHAFVMMKNHYHWLCSYNIKEDPGYFEWFHECLQVEFLKHGIQYIEAPFVKEISHIKFYQNTYKYVYSNPKVAGVVLRSEDYPFSTLPYVLGKKGLPFHCIDNMNVILDPYRMLGWINGGSQLSLIH